MSIDALRQEYMGNHLSESELGSDPIETFRSWFDLANKTEGIPEPNAMTLATVDSAGQASARIVLLKGLEPEGFVFYTNYLSRKGKDIDASSNAALVFWWEPLHRQVRIEGTVEKVGRDESQTYFDSRPRGSRVGAWVSQQSSVIDSRQFLDKTLDDYEAKFEGQDVPLPDHWGGYIVKPHMVEFWQGGERRLHDRIRFRQQSGAWEIDRLSP